ncbi:hypothetical protein BKA62DRAFT_768336 [Auriculariales sp. MPI-PUGE-AT-0066]|nr:hypothetical protein BKA62DRAFT_768336 [Auriculariales sp. MPI-PUGE-AT-0066]
MRRGLWHEPVLAAFVDGPRPAQDHAQVQPLALLDLVLPRQDTGTPTDPPVTPTPDPVPTTTTTESTSTTTAITTTSLPETSDSTSTTISITVTSDSPTVTTPPSTTNEPTGSSTSPPPLASSQALSTSTFTVIASTTASNTPGGSGLDGDNNAKSSSGGFWSNKAAVGAVFGLVGLAGLVVLLALVTNAVRRSRARKYDRELSAAASSGPPAGGYRDDDGEQPTYPFQNHKEDYDMHEFNNSYAHPYAVAGASGAAMAAGYHNNYHGQGNEYQGQDYGSEYAPHMSGQYPYSESGSSSYPSTAAAGGYYDPRQQGYPQHAQYPGPGQSSSPPPRDPFMSPPPQGMNPAAYNNGQVPPGAGYGAAPAVAGMAGMGAYGGAGFRGSEPPQHPQAAYSGSERGAYAHMQRQDQLNRALSVRSSAPTYASHLPPDQGTSHGGHILASGGPPLGDQKVPLPPMPPPEPSATHSHPAPSRPSGEHDAGNKSEGELPNPFRNRVSGEGESAEDWDDEESTSHGGQRVLKVANH